MGRVAWHDMAFFFPVGVGILIATMYVDGDVVGVTGFNE